MDATGFETARLDDVLVDLTASGSLSREQADAVRAAYAAAPVSAGPAEGPDRPRPLRGWLIEGAAYLGAVLVSASLLVIAAQQWSDLSYAQHLALLLVLGSAVGAVGGYVVRATPGGRLALREPAFAARCRVASTALSLSAVLFAGAFAVAVADTELYGDVDVTLLGAAALALVLLVVANRFAPSVITDVAMFVATMTVVGTAVTEFLPFTSNPGGDFQTEVPPAQFRDYALPTAVAATALLWALVVAPRLTVPKLGVVLGVVVAFETALPAAASEPTRWWGLFLLAVLAVVGIVMLLRDRFWAWLVLSVLSVTAFVFILVGQSAGPAVAFLVAGVVLLGGAAAGSRLGRRRAAPG